MHRTIFIITLTLILSENYLPVKAQRYTNLSLLPLEKEEEIYFQACGLFKKNLLPLESPFIPVRAICGTPVLVGLVSNWDRLSKRTQNTFSFLFSRPNTTHSKISPGGRFKIHYNTNGPHGVDLTDENKNKVPDYVDETAKTFDSLWDLEINQLGYNPPPSDGDEFYDVYIQDLSGQSVYAFTYPEGSTPATSSYMEIDNNYTDNIYHTRNLEALHVTAAHEFFHAIQFGYYSNFEAAWWQELTATWMEEVAYNEVNDYYQYLTCKQSFSCFFDSPHIALDNFNPFFSLRPFGASVFAIHLEQVYGRESIRKSWEILGDRKPSSFNLSDIDSGIPSGGFASLMPRFTIWNYLTNTNYLPGYYPEADRYPPISRVTAFPTKEVAVFGSGNIDHLGSAYIQIPTKKIYGGIKGEFTLDSKATWKFLVLLLTEWGCEILWPAEMTVEIPDVSRYKEIVFIPIVVSLEGEGFEYTFNISVETKINQPSDRVGDFTRDLKVNFADFITFSRGFNQKPSAATYNQHLDLNGDGQIDFQDFLIFISHFDG